MQGPMVMSFSKNIYCQQVPHGAFLMGRSNPFVEHNHDISSTHQFLDEMAKTVCEILPAVGELPRHPPMGRIVQHVARPSADRLRIRSKFAGFYHGLRILGPRLHVRADDRTCCCRN
ncbi:MAG: hypothetical protein MZU97_04985 [Bacillus subtilis]|nr:hypothetical protein [Bacillus subtilis]